jgi:hypothetical protein
LKFQSRYYIIGGMKVSECNKIGDGLYEVPLPEAPEMKVLESFLADNLEKHSIPGLQRLKCEDCGNYLGCWINPCDNQSLFYCDECVKAVTNAR